jgi:MFS family permease
VSLAPAPRVWGLVATVLGNALEFYDFLSYSFFALYIGRAFFPASDDRTALLLSVATFGIGFATRPLGSVVIGAYADRAGRKPALLFSFALMAVGTLAIVVTPGYATIGVAAPVTLVVARLVQGFALGGELGPSAALLVESAPPERRGLYTSLHSVSQAAASLAAGLTGLALSAILGTDRLSAWGFRLPFALGLAIVPVGLYVRRRLPETMPAARTRGSAEVLRLVWRGHRATVLRTMLVLMCLAVGTSVESYVTTYALTTLKLPASVAMLAPVVTGAVALVVTPLSGRLADRFDRRRIMIASRVAVMLAVHPLFALLVERRTAASLVLVMAVLALLALPGGIATLATLVQAFPRAVRSSGISITYALAVTLFGGTTQLVVTWLIGATGDPLAPAWYVIGTSAVSVLAMFGLPRAPADEPASR